MKFLTLRKGIVLAVLAFSLAFPAGIFAQSNVVQGKTVTLDKDKVVNDNYFAAGQTVIVSGTVNGDAYVAGSTVLVDGTVNGDLLVAGGDVTIKGTVSGDVRAVGGQILVSGGEIGRNIGAAGGKIAVTEGVTVGGGLTAAGGQVEVNAPLGMGMQVGSGSLTIGSLVPGNVVYAGDKLFLSSGADVGGNLVYYSNEQMQKSSDATIAGTMQRNELPQQYRNQRQVDRHAVSKLFGFGTIVSFVSSLLFGLLFVKFVPNVMHRVSDKMRDQFAKSLGVGFLAMIVVPVSFFLLLITVFGIPLALVLLAVYLLVVYFSKLFAAVFVGQLIAKRFMPGQSRYVVFIVGIVLYYVVGAIPVIGWIARCVLSTAAVGAMLAVKKDYYHSLSEKKLL